MSKSTLLVKLYILYMDTGATTYDCEG